MDRLPPLGLLSTFSEVVRCGSMRDAAIRLNVTQPAVTQSIKALENHVGVRLFDRSTRPARLTVAGAQLAGATRDGLGQIEAAIEDIKAREMADERQITVACTLGMATYWLMPRLPDFYGRHPEIIVNVQAPPSGLPGIGPMIDVALRYGQGGWDDGETVKLFDERVCPVGRPSLVRFLLDKGGDLSQAPLVHVLASGNQNWADWREYFRRRGLRHSRLGGETFDNYVQAVQATLDGRGLMLGWRSITRQLEAEGALSRWPDGEVDLRTGYFVTSRNAHSGSAAKFVAWICGLGAAG